ncbi:hypothetical protein G6F63_016935 [Rhizopus arrhizus]|nr:hypothetical protein G6F63_016935 [Rhizopus arrhizus]
MAGPGQPGRAGRHRAGGVAGTRGGCAPARRSGNAFQSRRDGPYRTFRSAFNDRPTPHRGAVDMNRADPKPSISRTFLYER